MKFFHYLTVIIFLFCATPVFASDIDKKIIELQPQKTFFKNKINSNIKNLNNIKKEDITVAEVNGIYTIKLDTKILKGDLKPYYVSTLTTNEDVFKETGARLVINGGFFDPHNHQTVSYVTINGETILDPHNNNSLMNNKHLKPYLDKILNRSEFRILKSKETGELLYDITPHNAEIKQGYTLLHSIQGGPALVPEARLAEEFFVLTDSEGKIISESASSLSKYARTLLGIKNNDVYFIIATKEHPITLPEASEMLKEAGFEKAMAFDGGGSVSVDFKDKNIHIISDKNQTARKLKSFFIVTEVKQANPQKYLLINSFNKY